MSSPVADNMIVSLMTTSPPLRTSNAWSTLITCKSREGVALTGVRAKVERRRKDDMNRSNRNNAFFKWDTTLINEPSLFCFAYLSSIIPYLLLEIQSINITFVKLDDCPKLHVFMLKSAFCNSLIKKLLILYYLPKALAKILHLLRFDFQITRSIKRYAQP